MKTVKFFFIIFIIPLVLFEIVLTTPQWYQGNNGKRFLIDSEYEYNWFQASNECARRNLQLVVIDVEEKNKVLGDVLKHNFDRSPHAWIGGNDQFNMCDDKKRPFFWTPTGQQFSFTNWINYQPDNMFSTEHCVHVWEGSEQWNDENCVKKLGFVCEDKEITASCLELLKKQIDNIDC